MHSQNEELYTPNIRLLGPIGTGSFWSFCDMAAKAREIEGAFQ